MGSRYKTTGSEDEDIWTINDNKKNCRFHTAERPILKISPLVIQKVQALCLMHKDTEFLVYLYGDCTCQHVMSSHGEFGRDKCNECNGTCNEFTPNPKAKEDNKVADIYIPKQEVTSGSVHMDADDNIPTGCIGALHKHPGDGRTRFSCIDDDNLNVNHDISIVIPESGALQYWYATVRQEHPCGCNIHGEARTQFLIVTPDVFNGSNKRITKVTHQEWVGASGWPRRSLAPYESRVLCRYKKCDRSFVSSSARESHEKDKHGQLWTQEIGEQEDAEEVSELKESYGTRD